MLIINQIDTLEELEGVIRKVLKENTKKETPPPEEELLDIQQAAGVLKLTVPTVYGLNHRRLLPGVCKKGKRLYFIKQGLLDYIKSGKKLTNEELKEEAIKEFRHANQKK